MFTFVFQTKVEAFGLDSKTLTDAERRPQKGQIKKPASHEPADLPQASTSSARYDINVQSDAQTSRQQVHPRAEAEVDDEYEVPSKYMNNDENIYLEIDDMEMDDDDVYEDTEL